MFAGITNLFGTSTRQTSSSTNSTYGSLEITKSTDIFGIFSSQQNLMLAVLLYKYLGFDLYLLLDKNVQVLDIY